MPAEMFRQPSPDATIELSRVALVLPAYNAGQPLLDLLCELEPMGFAAIVVVDDGSSPAQAPALAGAGRWSSVHVVRHPKNRGKGCALKTGLRFVRGRLPQADVVVTADADGQHLAADIARIVRVALQARDAVVLGVRSFGRGAPLRSRLGNRLTAWMFARLTGVALEDTQTGLRAFPGALIDTLTTVPGERYEYETAVLAHMCGLGRPLSEVPIATVYRDGNAGSHFRAIADSARIALTLARYACRVQRVQESKGRRTSMSISAQ